jgi:hypothetical protein
MASNALHNVRESFDNLPPWAKYGIIGGATAIGAYYIKSQYCKTTKPIKKEWKKGL